MRYYLYRQNNSRGRFQHDAPRGISRFVYIEAESTSDADDHALGIGIYFDGCDDGTDCACCGDRWYRAEECNSELAASPSMIEGERWMTPDPEGYVHRADWTFTPL